MRVFCEWWWWSSRKPLKCRHPWLQLAQHLTYLKPGYIVFGWPLSTLALFTSHTLITQWPATDTTRKSPAWCLGRTSAPTGQQGYEGRLLPSNSFWPKELWDRAVMVVHADGLAFHQITSRRDQFHLCYVCLSHSGLIPQMGNWFGA